VGLTYKIVTYKDDQDRELVNANLERLSYEGNFVVRGYGFPWACDAVIPYWIKEKRTSIALDGRKLVGWLMWGKVSPRSFRSHGTWVHRMYRRQGIAFELWARMIQEIQPKEVFCSVITDRGMTLVNKITNMYPQINWDVCDDGERKLRDLRKVA
jgi:GNAT superfamily N-acetyltransferase